MVAVLRPARVLKAKEAAASTRTAGLHAFTGRRRVGTHGCPADTHALPRRRQTTACSSPTALSRARLLGRREVPLKLTLQVALAPVLS